MDKCFCCWGGRGGCVVDELLLLLFYIVVVIVIIFRWRVFAYSERFIKPGPNVYRRYGWIAHRVNPGPVITT